MAYQNISSDGTLPEFQEESSGPANGGWIWPGRGAFRVQTKQVHPDYSGDYSSAPAGLKDFFEGTVNAHWKSGVEVDQDMDFVARIGDRTIKLDDKQKTDGASKLKAGAYVLVQAANSKKFYEDTGVLKREWQRGVAMRSQIFKLVSGSETEVTLDGDLEFDLPANDTSDGSKSLSGASPTKVIPLTVVENVGFENFFMTYDLNGLPKHDGGTYDLNPDRSVNNYGNMAPEYALHGIIFKWAVNSWVKGFACT